MIETSPSSVDVVLPRLDETETLPWALERIPRVHEPQHGSAAGAGVTGGAR